jgi:3-phosphoshikimate 1-carboxyvinyltransferase
VKGAVLLAGLDADDSTSVEEPVATRDHTERAIRALGGPVRIEDSTITVRRFQHEGFRARVPGDPSSAAFLVAAAALTGSEFTVAGVGLNPSRLWFLRVMERMGIPTERRVEREELGEPVGDLWVGRCPELRSVVVDADELPLVIDEVPVLAALAAHAPAESRFMGGGELRWKESDRLAAISRGMRALGGDASVEGDDLVLAGGGLTGGVASSFGDHRIAMALTVGGLASRRPVEIDGMEAADVSFPGFTPLLIASGAGIEVVGT